MDETLTIDLGSPSLTIKYGAASRMILNGAVLCKAMIVSFFSFSQTKEARRSRKGFVPHCSSLIFSIGSSHAYPALLMMMWILPCPNSAVLLISSEMTSFFVISPAKAMAAPPSALIELAVFSALPDPVVNLGCDIHRCGRAIPASISAITTLQPSRAKIAAVSAPMPCAAPVMIAVCPSDRVQDGLQRSRLP